MKLAELFENRPEYWGFRGDPYFWDYLQELAGDREASSAGELETWIKQEHLRLSGEELTADSVTVVKQFAHGGMSSGGISGQWWMETGIPLLQQRLVNGPDASTETRLNRSAVYHNETDA